MTTSVVSHSLRRLQALYTAGFQNSFLDDALHKIVERQVARDEMNLRRVNQVLAQFERQYSMTSDEFSRRFQAGEMDDTADFMEWNSFRKMRQRIESELDQTQDAFQSTPP